MELLNTDERPIGDVIKPYVSEGKFVKDFWMKDRVGAMVGASEVEYGIANIILSGFPYKHNHVLGPDEKDKYWSEVMVSPGDNGWNPRGKDYRWQKNQSEGYNRKIYNECGAPKENQYGKWGNGGLPYAYILETNKRPTDRDLTQFCEEFGLGCGGKRNNKHKTKE